MVTRMTGTVHGDKNDRYCTCKPMHTNDNISSEFFLEREIFPTKVILFYIAIYNLLNINRVISKAEVREGREAGTIHRWFTGVLLLS